MKNLVLIFMLLTSFTAFSQPQHQEDEKIIVSTKDLPPGLVEQLKTKQTIDKYGQWAGIGKEVGIAVRDGLTAVKDVSVEFSNTNLGMYTMVLIAYKVVGNKIIALLICIPLMFIMTVVTIWSYKKTCVPRRVLVEDPGLFKYPKKYQLQTAIYPDGGGAFLHFACWAGAMAIMTAIMINVG